MPYKDLEEHRRKAKQIMRKQRERTKQFSQMQDMAMAQLDSLAVGEPVDFGVMHFEYKKLKREGRKMLLPVLAGMKLGDSLESAGAPFHLVMTTRFIAFCIPTRTPKEGSEVDKKILEILAKVAELRKLCEEE